MVSGDYGAWSGGKDEESCVAVILSLSERLYMLGRA